MKKQDEADGSAEETAGAKIANVRRKHAQDYQRKELYRNTMRYFEATPTPHHTTVKTQKALQALGRLPYALTSSEKLQLVNLHASAEVDVHVAVEECEDRIPGTLTATTDHPTPCALVLGIVQSTENPELQSRSPKPCPHSTPLL
mmetsp:Transcript_767/g.1953  ORF Transcript_767/g.1953 Transcript_767/m.1953 type:complete len:145 (-) Transcript_767:1174-1608(-)